MKALVSSSDGSNFHFQHLLRKNSRSQDKVFAFTALACWKHVISSSVFPFLILVHFGPLPHVEHCAFNTAAMGYSTPSPSQIGSQIYNNNTTPIITGAMPNATGITPDTTVSSHSVWYHGDWATPAAWLIIVYCVTSACTLILLMCHGYIDRHLNVSRIAQISKSDKLTHWTAAQLLSRRGRTARAEKKAPSQSAAGGLEGEGEKGGRGGRDGYG